MYAGKKGTGAENTKLFLWHKIVSIISAILDLFKTIYIYIYIYIYTHIYIYIYIYTHKYVNQICKIVKYKKILIFWDVY